MWGSSTQHFVQQRPKTPPISSSRVTGPFNNFRSQVFWRSTETMCLLVSSKALLAQPKISYSNMPFGVEEDIFWFQISVDDSCSVKAADGVDYFSGVYLCSLFVKSLFFPQVCEKFTSIKEIDDKIEFRICLECIMQAHNIWILDFFQNVSFSYKIFNQNRLDILKNKNEPRTLRLHQQVFLYQLVFFQDFHRIWKLGFLMSDEIYFSE